MRKKMEVIYKEPEDETMEDVNMTSSSMMPTRSLARLAVKLKQLMQTNVTSPPMEVMMDIDAEEQKKRAQAITLLASAMTTATSNKCNKNPEPKKIHNDSTLPRTQPSQTNQTLPEEITKEVEQVSQEVTKMESNELMKEKVKPPEQTTMKMHHDNTDQLKQTQESHNDTTTMPTHTEEAQPQKEENKPPEEHNSNNDKHQSNQCQ